jgi:hypothetical protein
MKTRPTFGKNVYWPNRIRLLSALLVLVCVGAPGMLHTTSALAAVPAAHWNIVAEAWPRYFKPGDKGDVYTVFATNDGSLPTNNGTFTVAISLPKGIIATEITSEPVAVVASGFNMRRGSSCSLATLTCTFRSREEGEPAQLFPRAYVEIRVKVDVPQTPVEPVERFAIVSGGGAQSVSAGDPTEIDQSPVPFGLLALADITDVGGNPDTQAGSHPFEMTTRVVFNTISLGSQFTVGEPISNIVTKDIEVSLPPGLVGDPNAVPKCSQVTLNQSEGFLNCPPDTQVGLMLLELIAGSQQQVPVYNVEPPPGQPAELGFGVAGFIHVPMFFHVRSDGDYGLTARLRNLPEAAVIREGVLSLWGVPADPAHNRQRRASGDCIDGCASDAPSRPFLTLPSSCPAEGVSSLSFAADSWQSPGVFNEDGSANLGDPNWATAPPASLPPLKGCGRLSFAPSISVAPDIVEAGSPSGYTVDLRVPQSDEPGTLATPDLRRAVVTLPDGTVLSPSAADGLEGCSDEQFGLHSTGPASCPAASQVGRLKITTPLLSSPLEGQVFVGMPSCSPCGPGDAQEGRILRIFLQAQGSGVVIKLAGSVLVNQGTGQLTTTFDDNPQLPFSELELVLNGGAHAPLVNPAVCGLATTTSDLTPWSSPFTPDATPSSFFEVTGCVARLFNPSFTAGTINNQAVAFSPFTTTFSRQDSEQDLSGIQITMPPGLLGMLSSVPLCGEPQAASGTCSSASEIGHTTAGAGPGGSPVYLPVAGQPVNPVYLTTGYHGAPFGLSVVVPAIAGPFNLGTVVVRAAIDVDPRTAQITITSDPLPAILDGIPLRVRTVNVTVDRPGFIFNPTNCEAFTLAGTIASTQAAAKPVASPFEAVNCANLKFKPRFAISTARQASKSGGASLDVKVTSKGGPQPGGGEANIRSVKVNLPKLLPSRLTTLQKACLARVFEANPASCSKESDVGTATAATPVLAHSLTGPAYLVSHGGAAFPDLEIVLQGEGIALILDGSTGISKGVTSSTFRSVPDAPVSSFELKLPAGPYSVLTANLPAKAKFNLCGQSLVAPTAITGQNGAVIKQNTKIAVTGCPTARKVRRASHGKR